MPQKNISLNDTQKQILDNIQEELEHLGIKFSTFAFNSINDAYWSDKWQKLLRSEQ
jgi:hypothetical protein